MGCRAEILEKVMTSKHFDQSYTAARLHLTSSTNVYRLHKDRCVVLVSDDCKNYRTITGAVLAQELLITRLLLDGIHCAAQNG